MNMSNTLKRAVTVSIAAVAAMSTLSGCAAPIDTDDRWLVSKRIDEDGEVNTARDFKKSGIAIEFDIDGENVTYKFDGIGDTIEVDLKLKKTGRKTYDFTMGGGINFAEVTFEDEDTFRYDIVDEDGSVTTYWFERD